MTIEIDPRGVTLPDYGAEIAADLADFGATIVEARFREEHPGCTDDEVARAVRGYWSNRTCAPDGDVGGRVRVR